MSLKDGLSGRRIANKIKQALKGKGAGGDGDVLGEGPLNRHGMPKLPPGQHSVAKWPVLDLGIHPTLSPESWSLEVSGEVQSPRTFTWADFMALPQTREESDFHCVTRWSRYDIPFEGVRFRDLMDAVGLKIQEGYVFVTAFDDYTTNLSLADALSDDVMIVHRAFDAPLTKEHGGPVRMITPKLYAWKGAKWIKSIEIRREDKLGFWEERGYSNTARPWLDDRYS